MTTFQDRYAEQINRLFDETFQSVHRVYLEKCTSLCETLAQVTAEQASRPVSDKGTSVAAHVLHLTFCHVLHLTFCHVLHLTFYIDLRDHELDHGETDTVDWGDTWRITVAAADEWDARQQRLRQSYQKFLATLHGPGTRGTDEALACASPAVVAHTAYHPGAVHQLLRVA